MTHELTPYLAVPDARAAIDWYAQVLGAEVTVEPIVMPDGRIGHVELDADGAHWMMADAHPEIRSPAPTPGEGSPVTLHLTVADVDATTGRARTAGADVDREPGDNPGIGRIAVFRDPFGHRWMLNQPE
jgi:uncharacterized glyoxalase superfamily protein PhnB